MNSYSKLWKRYGDFQGRTSRKDFWLAVLVNAIIAFVLQMLYSITDFGIFEVIDFVYGLAIVIPSLAIGVRRMHDINKNGCWILISLIPIIGVIWFIVLAALSGDVNENEYGLPE